MIGNDIVDLNLAKKQSNWQREGFLEKQFTEFEQKIILNSENPFLQVWLFWSMKEAAYKCFTQKVAKRFFAPKNFECSLVSENKGIVTFKNLKFYTTTFSNSFYVYTVAKSNQEEATFFSNIDSLKKINNIIKLKLAAEIGVTSEEIEKRKSSIGAPIYYCKEKRLTKSCSISHHGNYGAFAFTLENEY